MVEAVTRTKGEQASTSSACGCLRTECFGRLIDARSLTFAATRHRVIPRSVAGPQF